MPKDLNFYHLPSVSLMPPSLELCGWEYPNVPQGTAPWQLSLASS